MIHSTHNNNEENIVILGGGIPGIFSSLYLSKLYPNSKIHLIESSGQLGGLYNSFNDNEGGVFDKGMHIIYETCIEEIDKIIRECLSPNQWLFLEGNFKDVAGVFHNNFLETKSPYMNINSISRNKLNKCLSEFFKSLEHQAPSFKDCRNVFEFFEKRFGSSITKELIEPVIKKLWRTPSKKLHPSATRIVLMDRLQMFSEVASSDLMQSSNLRSRIAYPNQIKLDLKFRNSQRGLYPKKFGMSNLIAGMRSKLIDSNIIIHNKSKIHSIDKKDNVISSIKISKGASVEQIESIKLFHSTVSSSQLLPYFFLNIGKSNFDKSLIQKYVFLLLDSPPNMDNLYYFFSFEKGSKIYRVTNYAAYCPSAKRIHKNTNKETWPICVELHYKNKSPNERFVQKDAIKELLKHRIIKSQDQIIFARIESAGGFPLLTLNNCKILEEKDLLLEKLNIKNLILAGQTPYKGIFFLHDILENIYCLINNFHNKSN
ncbi:MAG: hypothetical protein CMK49_01075 [Prochlorococcus sp. SP3034]|nr:hypothetical protein [Prochlorococcus sp. SP3034]